MQGKREPEPVESDGLGRAAILLVDDRPENLLALEVVLEPLGHELVRASSGEQALRQVLKRDFALILMDVMMPGMDGFETAALIKQHERWREVPIIFVTALAKEAQEMLKGFAAGAADYVTKPIDPDVLRAKVTILIELYLRGERIAAQRDQLAAERERLAAERAAREVVQTANRLKDELIAFVSHELRGPLNAVIGWCSLLQSEELDPERTQEAVASIMRSTHTQLRLIEDLLDLSRIAHGKLTLLTEPVHLGTILGAAVAGVRTSASTKQIELVETLDSRPESDATVGDPVRLEQVFWNLLSNAIKFTPSGGRVEILAHRSNGHFEVRIKDSGRGIPQDQLPHLFEPFWQSEAKSSRAGLGLGLAIVRHIVEEHGGEVLAESPGVDLGTTFTVSLPLRSTTS